MVSESTTTTKRPDSVDSTDSPEILINCVDVSHEYRRGQRSGILWWRDADATPTVSALEDVSLAVSPGETVGIAGPSGSGKSTLLHLIAGLTVPTAGHIEFDGTDLSTLSTDERTALRYRHIGLVFQRFHLLPLLSARGNVALPLVQSGVPKAERRERATSLLKQVGLADRATHTPGQLSGGEQQRVAIARALVTDPDVILADEPTGELDSETGNQVLDVLTDVAAKRAVIVASHDTAALSVADRVIRLHDGRLASDDQ